MNFKEYKSHGLEIGKALETDAAFLFFGNNQFTRASLNEHFPKYKFCLLQQIHSPLVIEADPSAAAQADGHFTETPMLAPIAQSADCVPILLANQHRVAALHAGWRGVAARIVTSAKEHFTKHPPEILAIGPHIRAKSFEVGVDVAEQIFQAAPSGLNKDSVILPHADLQKRYVDLAKIVRAQLQQAFPGVRIVDTLEDTFTDPKYRSFRRDKTQAGRQYSFVVLKD